MLRFRGKPCFLGWFWTEKITKWVICRGNTLWKLYLVFAACRAAVHIVFLNSLKGPMICSYRHAIHARWRTEKRCFNVPCWTIATYTRQVASIWISGICYPKDFVREQANVFLDGSLPAVKFSVSMHCVKTDDDSYCKGLWVILQKNIKRVSTSSKS